MASFSYEAQECVGYGCADKSIQVKILVESAKLQGIEVTPQYFKEIMDKVYLTGGERPYTPAKKCNCE